MVFLNAGKKHPASVMSGYNLMRSNSGRQDAQSNGNFCLHSYSHSKSWEKVRFSLILLILEKYMLIILHICSCNTKKLYSWQWQYLPVVTCQCKYFNWNGEHLSWHKCNVRICSPSFQLLSPHAPRHLAIFLSDLDGISAPTLSLHLLAFSCSCFPPN